MEFRRYFNVLSAFTLLVGASLFSVPVQAGVGLKYQIQPEDQISAVLAHLGVCPIWGKDGAVARAIALNPGEIDERGALLHPGAWIELPIDSLKARPKYYHVSEESREVSLVQSFVRKHWAPHCEGSVPMIAVNKAVTPATQVTDVKRTPAELVLEEEAPIATPVTTPSPTPTFVPVLIPPNPVPTAEPSLAPTEAPRPEPASKQYSVFVVSPETSFSRISSTDSATGGRSILGSGLNYGIGLGWEQHWSPTFQTALSFDGKEEQYSTTDPSQTLSSASHFLGSVAFDMQKSCSEDSAWGFGASAGVQQSLFERAQSLTTLTLDAVSTPFVGVDLQAGLLREGSFEMFLRASGNYFTPVSTQNYTVHYGTGFGAELGITQDVGENRRALSGALFLNDKTQNTSISSQSDLEVGFKLNIHFGWFGK